MTWTKEHTQLNDVLAELVPHATGITKFVRDAGIKPQMINFNGTALEIWSDVISKAENIARINELIEAVSKVYSDNPYLKSALSSDNIINPTGLKLEEVSNWRGTDPGTLEKLTYGVNTLLPISFLSEGIKRSRPVAKIQIALEKKTIVGTGFIFRIASYEDSYFITNHHVINDTIDIDKVTIIFNFELDFHGNSLPSKSFKIDSDFKFILSPVHELDCCILKLNDHNIAFEEFGCLELKDQSIEKNDFVNIIQHPGGQWKQISLYHNIVTHADERIVQYLTDTLSGSSGAPVFNSQWDVVALHHSGGRNKENEEPLPDLATYRNEGIRINAIIDFLNQNL